MKSNINTFSKFVLISPELLTNSDADNYHAHEWLTKLLNDNRFNYKLVNGCYKGSTETTYYVEFTSDAQLDILKRLGSALTQESILVVDNKREATLHYINGTEFKLGKFTQVPEYVAKDNEGYTYDIQHDAYYICK